MSDKETRKDKDIIRIFEDAVNNAKPTSSPEKQDWLRWYRNMAKYGVPWEPE